MAASPKGLREEAGIAHAFDASAEAARDLVACLPGVAPGDEGVIAVICGALLEIEAQQGAAAAMAVVEQMSMCVGARRLGDG